MPCLGTWPSRRHQRKIENGSPCYCCWSPLSDARGLRRQLARCRIESRGPSGLKRRAKPLGCPARSRRLQTRRAGRNGSGLWWRRSSHQATTSHRARQRSSTSLFAAACSTCMLPGRKGTALTACAAACGSAGAHSSGCPGTLSRVGLEVADHSRYDARLRPRAAARLGAAGVESRMDARATAKSEPRAISGARPTA